MRWLSWLLVCFWAHVNISCIVSCNTFVCWLYIANVEVIDGALGGDDDGDNGAAAAAAADNQNNDNTGESLSVCSRCKGSSRRFSWRSAWQLNIVYCRIVFLPYRWLGSVWVARADWSIYTRFMNPFKGQMCQLIILCHPGLTYMFNFWHSDLSARLPECQKLKI